jgi:hypothetical protein
MATLIKLTGKGFIREQPFTDPITQPTPAGLVAPAQNHSYIFPGDEIVAWWKVQFPADHPTAPDMNSIDLKSVKVSIIAKHPNVFDEMFSEQFLSSRVFSLDSFTQTFNNNNAPNIPWTSDGWARNLTTLQDRNDIKLPSGDFRRQIKFFTTHTPSSNQWEYYFFWPFLFRWEYWIGKNGVNNFFFDSGSPQNGKNEWWYHYFKTVGAGDWRIYTRIELYAIVQGEQTVFKSDLLLTPDGTGGDVNDYSSNPDWIDKSIKTSVVHGSPSNTPCLIKSNQFTEVWAFFKKNSAWSVNEQTKLSTVFSIEPFEGPGMTALTRGSSTELVGGETVFIGLDRSLTDDAGLGITDENGDFIVTSINGNGAELYFNALAPTEVKCFAMIDHNKLANVYPGVTKFTLYARLYNSYVDADKTRMGEKLMQVAYLVTIPQTNSLCDLSTPMCPFNLKVYAERSKADELRNDITSFYEYGDLFINAIEFTLQKRDDTCNGDFLDKQVINDLSLGRFFAFGESNDFLGGTFTDDYNKKYTGLQLDWHSVLLAYGIGNYRLKIRKTDTTGAITTGYSPDYCLKEWNCNLTDGSVIIEFWNEGLRGSLQDPLNYIDYKGGWYDRIRVDATFIQKGSKYQEERNQYGDSLYNVMKPYISEQKPEYLLHIKPIPGDLDDFISTNILQADRILVTACNSRGRKELIRIPVMNAGDYTPRDNNLTNPLSDVQVNFAYGQNNLRKQNSF